MRFLWFFFFIFPVFANSIKYYTPIKSCVKFNGNEYLAIRSFLLNKRHALLIADTHKLKTGVVWYSDATFTHCSNTVLNSPYLKLLKFIKNQPPKLQNSGITSIAKGYTLTTDLCPSNKKGFEERLYIALMKHFKKPVPVTLFITKRWIIKHKNSFDKLKKWDKEGLLKISWGNHTAKHLFFSHRDLEHNFVLSDKENLTKDILDLEIYLLKNGIVPSLFFRFPGLVSSKKKVLEVSNLGLIVIGTNCWLAKNQHLKNGSIVLLHGNKNEPKGVNIFLKILNRWNLPQPIELNKGLINDYRLQQKTNNTPRI